MLTCTCGKRVMDNQFVFRTIPRVRATVTFTTTDPRTARIVYTQLEKMYSMTI